MSLYIVDIHGEIEGDYEIVRKYEEQEPTTKNDLGVENDLVSSIVEKISEKVTETHEEFIFETIKPYCENVVQMKISKRDLEQALLEYYGKNNLGVDCISRQAVLRLLANSIGKSNTYIQTQVLKMPSVQSARIHAKWLPYEYGDKRWHKCSNCNKADKYQDEYKEQLFESIRNFCPNCGAKMVKPQESEVEDGNDD